MIASGTVLQQALAAHQSGNLDQATALYRQVLDADPQNADAHHLLGVAAKQQGDPTTAEQLIRRALEINPAMAQARCNLGVLLREKGDESGAERCFEMALAQRGDLAEAHANLGALYRGRGAWARAEDSLRRALSLQPGLVQAATTLGAVFLATGREEEAEHWLRQAAVAAPPDPAALAALGALLLGRGAATEAENLLRQALSLRPDDGDSAYNLAVLLHGKGDFAGAEAAYRSAADADPGDAAPWLGLCVVLTGQQRFAAAMDAGLAAFERDPDDFHCKTALVAAAAGLTADEMTAPTRSAIERLFDDGGIDVQTLLPVFRTVLQSYPGYADLAALGAGTYAEFAAGFDWPRFADLLGDPILRAGLKVLILPDRSLEAVLTHLRRWLLEAPRTDADRDRTAFAIALAHQCFRNEYVWTVAAPERDRAAAIGTEDAIGTALAACYAPLSEAARPAANLDDDLPALIRVQVDEPATEREIAAAIDPVGTIAGAVSEAVARQYEENPYPRWHSVQMTDHAPLGEVLAARLPHLEPGAITVGSGETTEVLIAGCGTGRQAIVSAQSIAGARVLAVDLSRASLAYGIRKAREMGIDNIDFRQADLMALEGHDRRFELIECTGVLHHLADPEAGWAVLRGLLAPGGVMRIALYSRIARRHVSAAREFVAERGFPATADGIRACRAALFEMADKPMADAVTQIRDLYTTSACRDLLFHVQEQDFTIPMIADALDRLDLDFLGFDLPAGFPDGPAPTDLGDWDRFEQANPDSFAGMYDFWVRDGIVS
jgi:Flp pilus assembly protein TadD/SAM-dependent methyltransferase